MKRLLPLLALALSACATLGGGSAVIAAPEPPSWSQVALTTAEGVRAHPEVTIEARLAAFAERAAALREANGTGAEMPALQHVAWKTELRALDAWRKAEPEAASGARGAALKDLLLQVITADAGTYGSLPDGWLDQVRSSTLALGPPQPSRKAKQRRKRSVPEMSWPMEKVQVTSRFGYRRHPIFKSKRLHKGVDLHARQGDRIFASAVGRVVTAHRHRSYGLHVVIDHGDGVQTTYSHMSALLVKRGDVVKAGDEVGLAGRTGRVTGVHLHFEVLIDGRPVDPLKLLGPVPQPQPKADDQHSRIRLRAYPGV